MEQTPKWTPATKKIWLHLTAGIMWSGVGIMLVAFAAHWLGIVHSWTGDVSPCWPLMHTHMSYLHDEPRLSKKHIIGNVTQRSLSDLWLDPDYLAYRERLHNFAFAPCT